MKQLAFKFMNNRVRLLFTPPLLAFLLLFSCTIDNQPDETPTPGLEGESMITLSLSLPANSTPTTRAMADGEEDVRTIQLLAFKEGKYVYTARNQGDIAGTGSKKTFTIKLRQGTGYDLVILANAEEILASAGSSVINTGKTKEEVLSGLSMSLSGKWNATTSTYMPFPMSSDPDDTELKNITVEEDMIVPDIKLYRMLAKISVVLGSKDGVEAKTAFDLKSVHVYNRNAEGWLKPVFSNGDYVLNAKDSRAEGASIYSGTEITLDEGTDRGISCSDEIYLFEANNTSSELTLLTRPSLVIGGKYANDAEQTYYRVDYSTDATTYLDILRNHHYMVNIDAVNGPGYSSPEEAFESLPVNMDVTVVPWDDSNILEVITDGQYELGVSRKEFLFYKDEFTEETDESELIVSTTYDKGWTISVMDGNNVATSGWLMIKEEGGEAAYSIGSSSTSQQKFYLQVEENQGLSDRTANIYVTAGRMVQVITVTQNTLTRSLLTITDENGNLIESIEFASIVDTDPGERVYTVKWAPKTEILYPSVSPVANPAGGSYAYPTWYYYNTLSGAIDNSGTQIYTSAIDSKTGTATFTVNPLPIKQEEIASDPFYERQAMVSFRVTGAEGTMRKNILLQQYAYNMVASSEEIYLADGGAYTFNVKSNRPWKAYLIDNGDGIVASPAVNTATPIATGGYNLPNGANVSFTTFNGIANPTKYIGTAQVRVVWDDGTATEAEQTVDLFCVAATKEPTSNSYMVSPGGAGVLIPVSRANEYASGAIGSEVDVESRLVWTDNQNGVGDNSNIRLVKTLGKGSDSYILVMPGEGSGNALVEAKVENETKWSWHIWVTDYVPGKGKSTSAKGGEIHQYAGNSFTSGINSGKYIMDRNLGATWNQSDGLSIAETMTSSTSATNERAYKTYGLMYQWGRKDPFPGYDGSGTNVNSSKIYDALGNNASSLITYTPINSAASNIPGAIKNPVAFYYNGAAGDWNINVYTSNAYDYLWGGMATTDAKTIYDPCPPGWRVPYCNTNALNNPWAGFGNSSANSTTSANTSSAAAKQHINGVENTSTTGTVYNTRGWLYPSVTNSSTKGAWYPAAGKRIYDSGTFDYVGQRGIYHTATDFGRSGTTFQFKLYFDTGTVYPAFQTESWLINVRAMGQPVRCIQE